MITTETSLTRKALSGKRVLITGTTGFLGKVLLEKIIREIPDVAGINLLIRGNKKHPEAHARFKAEILTSTIFERLRETDSEALEQFCEQKIQCIGGEITEPCFGLSDQDYQQLAATTDIFVNSAASVNFHEALDTALRINTLCLNNVADFAQDAGDIPVVQISTCYVNGYNNGIIHEAISKPTGQHIAVDEHGYYDVARVFGELQQKIAQVKASTPSPAQPDALTELGLREANRFGWGDTYTFTKWLGEQLILKRMIGKTLTILRPSVVESCYASPKPGWIEGVKVTDAILLAYAREKVSFFPARKAGVVDIIPVDFVANSVLLSMAEALNEPVASRIYQCCSGSQNPLGVERYVTTVCEEVRINWRKYPKLARKEPQRKFVLVNKGVFIGAIKVMKQLTTLWDRLRLRSATNKSKALKMVESTLKLANIYANYTSPYYVFNSDKLMALAAKMGERDQQLFPVDAAHIDWDRYFKEIHVAGLNHYGMEDRSKVEMPEALEEDRVESQLGENSQAPA
ncbi:MAG: SDR family oxidoreductase [Hahellaceae bacterium]|nr:SDR family oxidoreductase [Hahellaceae bacterium]MCP5168252.1 SDR family oxidoreductase [Hahellaceae bacterium]